MNNWKWFDNATHSAILNRIEERTEFDKTLKVGDRVLYGFGEIRSGKIIELASWAAFIEEEGWPFQMRRWYQRKYIHEKLPAKP